MIKNYESNLIQIKQTPTPTPTPTQVVIATPGRLNDLIEMRKADLSQIEWVVLDEADRMLDMGFEPQIRQIMNNVTHAHQTMLFSATWPKEIQQLAREFLNDPVQINVGEVNALVANKDITQNILMMSEGEKTDKLAEILKVGGSLALCVGSEDVMRCWSYGAHCT